MINVSADISNSNSLVVRSSMGLRMPPSSNRILDIPCKVCGDNSSGKHYNIFACDGCAGFFKRSIRKSRQYECKGKIPGSCVVDKTHRNQCRACRLLKCQEAGMNKEAVQHERGPRNSTLKRQQQMVQIYTEATPKLVLSSPSQPPVLNLSLANSGFRPPFLWNPSANIFGSIPYRIPFWCPPTTPQTKVLNTRDICETAAGILFFNVKWAKKIQTFTDLPLPDQLLLLEESWRDLFILGAAQYLGIAELGVMVNACVASESNSNVVAKLKSEVGKFQSILTKIAQYNVDAHELTCLRAMVLFKNNFEESKSKVLQNPSRVNTEQENSQLMLNKYTLTAQPLQPLRFGQLLLLLPELKTVSSSIIEDLFFKNTIGNVPIVNVILNVYQAPDL